MRFLLLLLSLVLQLNISGFANHNPHENHVIETHTSSKHRLSVTINQNGEYKIDCPFRYAGQYFDEETGLGYNRFRYIDYDTGSYISQDPIRIDGNNPTLYAYVHDPNSWVDKLGLIIDPTILAKLTDVTNGYNGQAIYIFTDAATGKPYVGSADELRTRMRQQIESGKLKDLDSLTFDRHSGLSRQKLFDLEAKKMAELGGLKSGVLTNQRRPRNTGDTAKKRFEIFS